MSTTKTVNIKKYFSNQVKECLKNCERVRSRNFKKKILYCNNMLRNFSSTISKENSIVLKSQIDAILLDIFPYKCEQI